MLKEVLIPDGVEVAKQGTNIVVKGPKGELQRPLSHPSAGIKVEGGKVVVSSADERRRSKAMAGTFAAHIKNMVDGVSKGYEARLKVVYSHFPVRVNVEDGVVVIQNFIGGKKARRAEIYPETQVKVEKDVILITGTDKEKVGITAARIEGATKVTGVDRRVFSDGVYITQKPQVVGGEETPLMETKEAG